MAATFLDIAITPDVIDVQHEMGSDSLWQTPRSRSPGRPLRRQRSGDDRHPRQLFIWRRCRRAAGPTFSIAAARRGFCICWMTLTLAMADFGGNRQYITTGNLRGSDRACLFLMDYPRRARLKIYATVEVGGRGPPAAAGAGGADQLSRPH